LTTGTQAFGALRSILKDIASNGLGAPVLLMVMLSMMVLPLPPFVLDVFFTFNIALSLIVLMAVVYIRRPLEFAAFPTVLLVTTLLRLSLNIASTRVVLLEGHAGPGAAGRVIQAFGDFVVGGNFAVGIVVFAILVIINFVVVTKGAGRISEVSARFTLDAMPGKQMAIDADLNAGVINQNEARTRRSEVMQEADFYGSMDGASKFVRGDAVAGILILFINVLGGLSVGVLQHGLGMAEAGRTYTLLTVGDGLVAQIPALFLSTSAAIMVTRVSSAQDMGEAVAAQLFRDPRALGMTSAIIGIMGLIPGMPNFAFLTLALAAGTGAWWRARQIAGPKKDIAKDAVAAAEAALPPPPQEQKELSWDDVVQVDLIGLEVGYRLIPLVDKAQGGQLMKRIKGVRKKLSQDFGFLIPPVHIRDNLDLAPNGYRISLLGVAEGEGDVYPERDLAINPGKVYGRLPGIETKEPAFGLEAVWIEASQRDQAQTLGYTVVDAPTVIATHLSQILQDHSHELLGREEVQHLLDKLKVTYPKLVEDLVPTTLPLGIVQKVLRNLLEERISLRDMRTIAETLAAGGTRTQDPNILTAATRISLGRSIVQNITGITKDLSVITLDPALDHLLTQGVQTGGEGGPVLEPGLTERFQKSLTEHANRQELQGLPAVLLVSAILRPWLSRFVKHSLPNLYVLSYHEVPEDRQIRIVGVVGR